MNNQLDAKPLITLLDYQSTSVVDLFSAIESQPWAMLLHSSAKEHVDNRYDILVADPIATLQTHQKVTCINVIGKQPVTSEACPFKLLAHYQERLTPHCHSIKDLPFIGGALGYFSYDLGRRVESIPSIAERDIPTADMAVGIYDWALIADHKTCTLTLIQPHGSNRLDWLQQFIAIKEKKADFSLVSKWQSNMTQAEYSTKFDTIQEYLKSGDCYQINLAQRFHAQYQGSEWLAYQKLATQNGAPFSAFIRTPELAILSVSPERFLQVKDRKIETKPIKGTRPRSSDPELDAKEADILRHSAKDRSENLMIVDLLRNDIGRVSTPGSVKVPKLFDIESFPAVHHLVSTITGQLDDNYTISDLLSASFPGGSITGAPKIRAMEIIEELEPHRRNLYCGSIGYISRCGNMDTSITIRTLIAYQDTIYASAGGGIVADSQTELEYEETLHKLSKILPIL
ncbi:aminodeoxychorismate synthase component I [Aliivibrio sp. S4TY2]|uniref:aminodeoxychorismate synthase component I n=1 Tax=unclassified Aliivibrio TaxID=2645654 RepID=UPI002379D61A|nr:MULTISPECIES: aminodeoxychorismate synthase component I [unclassified Aliivibrio]MDD9156927.1 aminodeoxychorismate synthase component I [Aliivibrio sp. S4TY2]MDD9160859.1 aminodeoxychorismate synthase component I [Aliivibrio sp. S4TY1]MDD9164888.1 aminodeoxychorismate synthase component I [Aliivibrio sp. S4MY2]MDD9168837.1 aminodeoxychorismate synthase component I [Aliivibrio sp. S4MY4]MDD9185365.1 aminodeoxychorismate synthase component I [Aliivibrio sp. S4MY3]